jgi:hypothetical protein
LSLPDVTPESFSIFKKIEKHSGVTTGTLSQQIEKHSGVTSGTLKFKRLKNIPQ